MPHFQRYSNMVWNLSWWCTWYGFEKHGSLLHILYTLLVLLRLQLLSNCTGWRWQFIRKWFWWGNFLYCWRILSTVDMYVKRWFILSLSTGGWIYCSVSITSNFLSGYCVVMIPLRCRFIWPLSFAGELSGRYFSTAVAVRPGHAVNWLFRVALMSVRLGWQKRNWWRYRMRFPLEVIW